MSEIDEIRRKAAQIAGQATDGFPDDLALRAALLTDAIDAAKPALPALSIRFYRRYYIGRSYDAGATAADRVEYFDEQGVVLVDGFVKEETARVGRRAVGQYGGRRLVVLSDARLAELERSGSWGGERDAWNAALRVIEARDAAAEWDVKRAIKTLLRRMDQELERLPARDGKDSRASSSERK